MKIKLQKRFGWKAAILLSLPSAFSEQHTSSLHLLSPLFWKRKEAYSFKILLKKHLAGKYQTSTFALR
ncbi:hypothetical protein [Cnuella takakiae]|uniref:hypothetical protein n=1 Tax=Cnuella takakiae TaxID=1302690 RepID=UPI001C1FE729|nr:hypothetical protein [Cnuella takakiae]